MDSSSESIYSDESDFEEDTDCLSEVADIFDEIMDNEDSDTEIADSQGFLKDFLKRI